MSVFACGLNTSEQVLAGGPTVLCCPSPVCLPSDLTSASVAFSHILWKTDSGWHWTGHDAENYKNGGLGVIKSNWKVFVCENSLAAINDKGSVMVWKNEWKTLHFQKEHIYDKLSEKLLEYENDRNEEEKKILYSNITRPELSEVLHENSNYKREHFNSCIDDVSGEVNCRDQEGMNKRLKVEKSAEEKDKASCNTASKEISFSKVAIEDNLLLALDTDGVMYWGNISVPLRVRVSDVAVGKEHCMALTVTGNILTWGNGMRGQLGIGELCYAENPVLVENLQGVCISSITCGAWHCAALSESGDLYVWGWNETGQLGFPYKSESSYPLFHFFEHSCQCPKSSSLQYAHSHTDSSQGSKSKGKEDVGKDEEPTKEQENSKADSSQNCQISGKSKEQEDMHKDEEETGEQKEHRKAELDERINPERSQEVINVQASPVLLDFWREDVNIHDVQCGDRHTLFLLEDGSVWSAGMNRYGQLGAGHINAVMEPCQVLRGGISAIHAGGWNSIFISSRDDPTSLKV